MPGEPKHYDLSAIAQWREQDLKRQHNRGASDDDAEADKLITRRIRAAELKEAEAGAWLKQMRAEQAAGKLLPSDEVSRGVIDWAVRIRTPLLALADRITNHVPGDLKPITKRLVGDTVRLTLKEAHDQGPLGKPIEELILEQAEKILEQRRQRDV